MATYKELRDSVLFYLQVDDADEKNFVRGDTDMLLIAANNAQKAAVRRHDFNSLLGSFETTVSPGTSYSWKTSSGMNCEKILGFYINKTGDSQLAPIDWVRQDIKSVGLIREGRQNKGIRTEDYIEPDEYYSQSLHAEVLGDQFVLSPPQTEDVIITIKGWKKLDELQYLEDTNFLLEYGFDWMMWHMLVELNHYTKQFVHRQEGNLPIPTSIMKEAWMELISWDDNLYTEQQFAIE